MSAEATEVCVWGGNSQQQLGLPGKVHPLPAICRFRMRVKEISCGEEHVGIVTIGGEVMVLGGWTDGKLGLGEGACRDLAEPTVVDTLKGHPAVNISCGWSHTAVVTADRGLYCWGNGAHGALGLQTGETFWRPEKVRLASGLVPVKVSAGARHTAVICETEAGCKELWTCGRGEEGQLGTGRREIETEFQRVSFPEPVQDVSCGVAHTGFVTSAGRVYTTGDNTFGQLGINSTKSHSLPQRLSSLDPHKIVSISCSYHSAVVSQYGEVFIWGTGPFGEFLVPRKVGEIAAKCREVAVGDTFTAVLDENSRVWTWGGNTSGELGLGHCDPQLIPSLVEMPKNRKVRKIACGSNFTVAICSDLQPADFTYMKAAIFHSRGVTAGSSATIKRENEGAGTQVQTAREVVTGRRENDDFGKNLSELLREIDASEQRDRQKETETNEVLTASVEALQQELTASRQQYQQLSAISDEKSTLIHQLQSSLLNKEKEYVQLKSAYHITALERDKIKEMVEEYEIRLHHMNVKAETMRDGQNTLEAVVRKKENDCDILKIAAGRDRETIDSLQKESGILQQRIAAAQKEKEELIAELQVSKSNVNLLTDSLQSAQSDVNSLETAKTELQHLLSAKESEHKQLRGQYELVVKDGKESGKRQVQLQELVEVLEGKVGDFTSERKSHIAEIESLRSALATLRTDYRNIATDKRDLMRSFEELKRQLEDITARFESDLSEKEESQRTSIQQQKDLYEGKISSMKATIESLESALAAGQKEASVATSRNGELQCALEALQNRVEKDIETSEKRLKSIVESYEVKLRNSAQTVEEIRESEEILKQECERLMEEIQTVTEMHIQEHSHTVETYENQLLDSAKSLADARRDKEIIENQLKSAVKAIKSLEDNYRNQLKKWELTSATFETDCAASLQLATSDLTLALDDEKRKNAHTERSLKETIERNKRLEDTIQVLSNRTDSMLDEIERMRVDLAAKDSVIRSLKALAGKDEFGGKNGPDSTLVSTRLDTSDIHHYQPRRTQGQRRCPRLQLTPIAAKQRPNTYRKMENSESREQRNSNSALGFARDLSPISVDTTRQETGDWGSYGELKAGFQSHLRDIQRKIDEYEKLS